MVYLGIFVAVALLGIGGLWVAQQRQLRKTNSVEGFRSSLERISTGPVITTKRPGPVAPRPHAGPRRRPAPLDPARREAAKRRLEHRRASRP